MQTFRALLLLCVVSTFVSGQRRGVSADTCKALLEKARPGTPVSSTIGTCNDVAKTVERTGKSPYSRQENFSICIAKSFGFLTSGSGAVPFRLDTQKLRVELTNLENSGNYDNSDNHLQLFRQNLDQCEAQNLSVYECLKLSCSF